MNKKAVFLFGAVLLFAAVVVSVVVSSISMFRKISEPVGNISHERISRSVETAGKPERFQSEEEFRKYFSEAASSRMNRGWGQDVVFSTGMADMSIKAESAPGVSGASRFSGTNVQVMGIDEPDIVKTDGRTIFFSRELSYHVSGPMIPAVESSAVDVQPLSGENGVSREPLIDTAPSSIRPSESVSPVQRISIIDAVPASELSEVGVIGRSGEMLLFGNTLVVFETARQNISGYDISDRKNPKERWTMKLDDRSSLLQARAYDGNLYIVERTWGNESISCPFIPLSIRGTDISIPCTEIYRPSISSSADSIVTALAVNPDSGEIRDQASFSVDSGQSTVYMSERNLYVASSRQGDPVRYMLGFFRENSDLLSTDVVQRIERLSEYDLGNEAKMMELSRIMEKAFLNNNQDERLRIENEMRNRMESYAKNHLRETEFTDIVSFSLPDLSPKAGGTIPGHLLNQFSLDEFEGVLRVATTVGARGGGISFLASNVAIENDVYTLNEQLRVKGSITGLGEEERIYSVRFVGEAGYLVTFRETDPFYVLDLSDPDDPRKAGELKIPGYSSYLHPLSDSLVLGIGKDGQQVKLSLFDVSSPDDPREISKYVLDEYWSEAIGNHRAFLADPKHKAFFLPGGRGGYVFSYDGNQLSLKKTAKDDRVKRAVFIGDTFYIVSENAVYAYDESSWEKVGEHSL